jgi:hypothetical protein
MQVGKSFVLQSTVILGPGARTKEHSPSKPAPEANQPPSDGSTSGTGGLTFNERVLMALLSQQEVDSGPVNDGANAVGQGHLAVPPVLGIGQPLHSTAFMSSAGQLSTADVEGKSASSLAQGLVATFGSNGQLSKGEVEKAILMGATANQDVISQIAHAIDKNWNALSGGSSSMTTEQLSGVIGKYLLSGTKEAS